MNVVSFTECLAEVNEYWQPLIVGELNGQLVKVTKLKGEFVMHHHEAEDEMFIVLKGNLEIEFANEIKSIGEGEFIIIPRGVEHKPIARDEVHIVLFEPKNTLNTGNVVNEKTVFQPKKREE